MDHTSASAVTVTFVSKNVTQKNVTQAADSGR